MIILKCVVKPLENMTPSYTLLPALSAILHVVRLPNPPEVDLSSARPPPLGGARDARDKADERGGSKLSMAGSPPKARLPCFDD